MNKNFTLQSFKSAVSNASDYLKGKGFEASHSAMLEAFSIFLGSKNWNTLQASLKEKNTKNNDLDDIYKHPSGIILVISKNEQEYIDYINNVIMRKIFNIRENDRIIRNLAEEKYYKDYLEMVSNYKNEVNGNRYFMSPFENINYNVLRNAMRRSPHVIICDNILYSSKSDLIMASQTGHLVIAGMKAEDEIDALTKVWDTFSRENNYHNGYFNSHIVRNEVRKVIDLNIK